MALSRSIVEAAEQLLCDGVPKLQVCSQLEISRTSVERISRGKHPTQGDPAAFLTRYSQRRPMSLAAATSRRRNETPIELVERVEMLLCWYWRENHARYPMVVRTLQQITDETGVCRQVVDKIARRRHPAQLERDGVDDPHSDLKLVGPGTVMITHSEAIVAKVKSMLADNYSQRAISFELGITPRTVRRIANSTHFHLVGQVGQAIRTHHMIQQKDRAKPFRPSPRRILRACEQIRRTWTREEEAARYCGRRYWSAEPQSLAS